MSDKQTCWCGLGCKHDCPMEPGVGWQSKHATPRSDEPRWDDWDNKTRHPFCEGCANADVYCYAGELSSWVGFLRHEGTCPMRLTEDARSDDELWEALADFEINVAINGFATDGDRMDALTEISMTLTTLRTRMERLQAERNVLLKEHEATRPFFESDRIHEGLFDEMWSHVTADDVAQGLAERYHDLLPKACDASDHATSILEGEGA